jgi:hypothetical protein
LQRDYTLQRAHPAKGYYPAEGLTTEGSYLPEGLTAEGANLEEGLYPAVGLKAVEVILACRG